MKTYRRVTIPAIKNELNPKHVLAVPCPTCGDAPGETVSLRRCQLERATVGERAQGGLEQAISPFGAKCVPYRTGKGLNKGREKFRVGVQSRTDTFLAVREYRTNFQPQQGACGPFLFRRSGPLLLGHWGAPILGFSRAFRDQLCKIEQLSAIESKQLFGMERTTIDLTAGICSLLRQQAGLLRTPSTGDDVFIYS